MTLLPVSARQAPTTSPTYPVPMTVMFMQWARMQEGRRRRSCAEVRVHRGHDLVELRSRQLGIDRQRQHFLRGTLALRALPLLVAEVGEARLEMERKRVVDGAAHASRLERGLEQVAAT